MTLDCSMMQTALKNNHVDFFIFPYGLLKLEIHLSET